MPGGLSFQDWHGTSSAERVPEFSESELKKDNNVHGNALGQVTKEDAEVQPKEQLCPGSVTYSESLKTILKKNKNKTILNPIFIIY